MAAPTSPSKAPPPEASPPPPPDLETCIKSIISTGGDAAARSTRDQAALIYAMMGYCVHLARDQDALATSLRSGKQYCNGLPFAELPAIRSLVTDPLLFQRVISMLSQNHTSAGTAGAQNPSHTALPPSTSYQQIQGRKRSPSEDVSHCASRKKLLLSPTPSNLVHQKQAPLHSGCEGPKGQLLEKISVLAANILHTALRHADNWPVQIMKAYAEDMFGPRNWVDNERCKAFVSNLDLSLQPSEVDGACDRNSTSAIEAEIYFSSLISRASQSDAPHQKVLSTKEKRKHAKQSQSSDSSSGEEEVLTASSSLSVPDHSHSLKVIFHASSISKRQVRPRYHMLDPVFEVVSDAFQERLNSKSKQNVRLLQVLPSFLCIPRVRCLASHHLERWLQSPALAGLARNLLGLIVQELQSVEPPLPDDLKVIDNILRLNLKANQLSMHIEHVTRLAKKLPTQQVAQMIFSHCLQGECSSGSVSNALKPNNDHLRMLRSVYAVLNRRLAAKALAASVSMLDILNPASKASELNSQFQRISCLLCSVVDALGELHDGFHFVQAMIEAKAGGPKTIPCVKFMARLIFECTLLVTRLPSLNTALEDASRNVDRVDKGELDRFRKRMLWLRKVVLRWCASDLCRAYYSKVSQEEEAKCADTYYERGAVTRGPGAPDFGSALDRHTSFQIRDDSSPFLGMMTEMCRLLFLSDYDDEEVENDRLQRVYFCCQFGNDVDDELIRIILSSPNATPKTKVEVIENLLARCGSSSQNAVQEGVDETTRFGGRVINFRVETLWSMWELAEYKPTFRSDLGKNGDSFSSGERESSLIGPDNKPRLPRLAVTSLWWRVSSIALVLSGILAEEVGTAMWNHCPTVKALVKMTTSQQYRFPTVDAEEGEKEKLRLAEEKAREEEAKIAEILFIPPQRKINIKPKTVVNSPAHHRRGLRSSARQREKKDRITAIEEERRAAALHAEQVKLRRVLKALQKNVMIWDPKQTMRKPPKGSISLLLAVNKSFGLAERFRLSTSPDFLLQTIGHGSGRYAIERSAHWLIPIISLHPAIIDRLNPSASCFLVLRAYGGDGDKNRELLDLTAPLLLHVSQALGGEFGQDHAYSALELLMQDIADESDDRRRCAKKVLQEAIGNSAMTDPSHSQHCGWLFQISEMPGCNDLVPLVVNYISRALTHERGRVLGVYISALYDYNTFLAKQNIETDFDFASTLCDLIAVRPHVCSDAFDRALPLRALAIAEVDRAFEEAIASNATSRMSSASSLVDISISTKEVRGLAQNGVPTHNDLRSVVISSNTLNAIILLLSIWQQGKDAKEETSIGHFLRYLVSPFTPDSSESVSGLSSAKYIHGEGKTKTSDKRPVSVKEWVMLAKARAETVAKQVALSAPNIFLPRLLLCCGMPKPSFHTMLMRLDAMSDSSFESGKIYDNLISRRTVSEWGLPGIGNRQTIKRKLHGRIMAYVRIYGQHVPGETSPFVSWLTAESSNDIHQKSQELDGAGNVRPFLPGPLSSEGVCENLMKEEVAGAEVLPDTWLRRVPNNPAPDGTISKDFVESCVSRGQLNVLEEYLHLVTLKDLCSKETNGGMAAKTLLTSFESFHGCPSFVSIVLKWVPSLTRDSGADNLWQLIFKGASKQTNDCHMMSLVCECALRWSDQHVAACQGWIGKCSSWPNAFSLELVLRFVVVSSMQKSISCFEQCDDILKFPFAQSFTMLALGYVSMSARDKGGEHIYDVAAQRNSLPDWLTLILLIGKSHQSLITRVIVDEMDDANLSPVLSSVLLRLYIMSPLKMDLSDSKLRNALLQASYDCLPSWLYWRCPLDCQISEMLSNLSRSPHQRLIQSISDIAKQHPLLLVRHLKKICEKLLEDGSGRDSEQNSLMKRGRIFGRSPDAMAQIGNQLLKVRIVLWGYSFSEPLWTSTIDVMMALPTEVAFSCGAKIGLTNILEAFLRLFIVQTKEMEPESNIIRVREKFVKFIESFKKCKPLVFESWLQSNISDWGMIRELFSVAGIGVQ